VQSASLSTLSAETVPLRLSTSRLVLTTRRSRRKCASSAKRSRRSAARQSWRAVASSRRTVHAATGRSGTATFVDRRRRSHSRTATRRTSDVESRDWNDNRNCWRRRRPTTDMCRVGLSVENGTSRTQRPRTTNQHRQSAADNTGGHHFRRAQREVTHFVTLVFSVRFLSTSQEIGWKVHLRNDPVCVEREFFWL